jgi:hypothetical protein
MPSRTAGTNARTAVAALLLLAAACTDQPLPTGTTPPGGPRAFPRTPNATENPNADRRVFAIQISVGELNHACVLESDNQVICWGAVGDIPFSRYRGPYTWVAAGGAGWADCGIRVNGTIHCFNGFVTPPSGTFTRISLGVGHGCGIRTDETIACWGDNAYGQATPPTGSFKGIDAGERHTCGIRTDGSHECWGDPTSSDVDPDNDNSVPDWGPGYLQVSAGKNHTCAIKANGSVQCGGSNQNGQVDGTISSAIDVSAGEFHTCAVSSAFAAFCWGFDIAGETEPPSGQYTSIAAGGYFTCAITKVGNVRCWGSKNFGMQAIPYEIADTQDTETSLEIAPRPSTFGAKVTMTATITVPARIEMEEDQAEVPSSGRVMFIDGGTCASPTTVLAAGVAVEPFDGTATFQTTALSLGTHSIGACYLGGDGLAASGDGAILEVGPAVTTTSISLTPLSQQYSDRVTLEAAVTPATVNGITAAGTVQFSIDGTPVGSAVAIGTGGKATLPNVQLTATPGPHQIGAQFTSSDEAVFNSSTAIVQGLTITKEDASIGYATDNATAVQVSTSGGSLAANALVLKLSVKEAEPDAAVSPGTTGIGSNIGGVVVSVSLLPIGPGSTYALSCTATGVAGTGYATARNFTCKNPAALPVNVYAVQATLSSDYYQALQYDDVVTVYDPVAGFATGGGTFQIDGDLVRFGINMKYKTNGKGGITATQGSVFAVRHHANGRKSRMESTSLNSAVAVGEDPTVPMGWAVVAGKANYMAWDAATSSYVTEGGQSFTIYVEDRGEPGAGKDRVWMGGPGALKLPGTLATAGVSAVTLNGGNVAVPHKAP